MPILDNDNMESFGGTSGFGFSGIRPDALGSTEFTIVSIQLDETGSMIGHEKELKQALIEAVNACISSPRSENIILRVGTFSVSQDIEEIHGFLPLNQIDSSKYPDFHPSGGTALYDASFDCISSAVDYAKTLVDNRFDVNVLCIIVTDGEENASQKITDPKKILDKINSVRQSEVVDSILSICIGITSSTGSQKQLSEFVQKAGIDHFISIGDLNPKNLGKLGGLISESISSQSAQLGKGQPASLSF